MSFNNPETRLQRQQRQRNSPDGVSDAKRNLDAAKHEARIERPDGWSITIARRKSESVSAARLHYKESK